MRIGEDTKLTLDVKAMAVILGALFGAGGWCTWTTLNIQNQGRDLDQVVSQVSTISENQTTMSVEIHDIHQYLNIDKALGRTSSTNTLSALAHN